MEQLVNNTQIEVIAMGNGWQSICLRFDETEIGFLASYIGDCPLSTLITLVARIDDGIDDGEATIKRHTEWFQEPGAMQVIVESDGIIDNITIKKTAKDQLEIDFNVEDMENPEETYHFQVRHEDLRNAVITEATRMLKEFGIQGYNENWYYGLDNFPVASFLQLLGNKTTPDEDGDIYISSLEDEINLLKSIL